MVLVPASVVFTGVVVWRRRRMRRRIIETEFTGGDRI